MKLSRPHYRMVEQALKVEIDLMKLDEARRKQRDSGALRFAPFPIAIDGMKKEIVAFYRWTVELLERLSDAITQNEGSAIVVEEGGALPTAAKEYVGKLVHLSKTAADDELWWCRKAAAGTYEWKQVQVI
jgi:hypothetical protein